MEKMRLIDIEKINPMRCPQSIQEMRMWLYEMPTVEAVPIEWIKKWCNKQNSKSLEERLLKRYGVITMFEDWEKESGAAITYNITFACHANVTALATCSPITTAKAPTSTDLRYEILYLIPSVLPNFTDILFVSVIVMLSVSLISRYCIF